MIFLLCNYSVGPQRDFKKRDGSIILHDRQLPSLVEDRGDFDYPPFIGDYSWTP